MSRVDFEELHRVSTLDIFVIVSNVSSVSVMSFQPTAHLHITTLSVVSLGIVNEP